MNSTSIDFKEFIECDNNPFILFNNNGKIDYLNNAAELLLGYIPQKELYDIVLAYAPKNYGYKTTAIPLQYNSFSFYAITVGYQDEEHICIRLYHQPRINPHKTIDSNTYTQTDINTLLEANITLFRMTNDNHLSLLVDQDIPSFKIDQNKMSKLFRKVLESFRASDSLEISLKFMVGEFVIINDKKESLIQFHIYANGRYADADHEIQTLAGESHISTSLKEHSITLEIPLIK